MNENDIALFLRMNEPVFEIGGKQYSVCAPSNGVSTWDSDGNMFDFTTVHELLERWIVDGKPFREIVATIMQ